MVASQTTKLAAFLQLVWISRTRKYISLQVIASVADPDHGVKLWGVPQKANVGAGLVRNVLVVGSKSIAFTDKVQGHTGLPRSWYWDNDCLAESGLAGKPITSCVVSLQC